MADLKYEITEYLGVIKEKKGGWKKELNLVSWAGKAPKYDVRDWSSDHKKMSKGVTLTEEELLNLYKLIGELFFSNDGNNDGSKRIELVSTNDQEMDLEPNAANYTEDEVSQGKYDYGEVFLEELTRLENELFTEPNDDFVDDTDCDNRTANEAIETKEKQKEHKKKTMLERGRSESNNSDRKLEKAFRKKYRLIKQILYEDNTKSWYTVNDICELISKDFPKESEWELFQAVKIILSNASWVENRATYYRWNS